MSGGRRRVAVTGLGIVSSLGFSIEEFFERLYEGEDATGPITSIATEGYRKLNAGEIKEPIPIPDNWAGYSRASQMALLAARNAISDSKLIVHQIAAKTAVSFGTMNGGAVEVEKQFCDNRGVFNIHERLITQYSLQSVADTVAYEFQARGLRNTVMTACASGTAAIGIGFQWIRRKRADIVICGGVDSFRPLTHLGLSSFRIVSPDKVRPFDAKRKGTLVGEGAGILILEDMDHAIGRNAKIYCEVQGYGASCDANDLAHPQENGYGMALAMERAIADSGIDKDEIRYVNAHGTGTDKNDFAEISATKRVLGIDNKNICISSIKGAIGHTIGAAGGIEAVATVLSIYNGKVPPTVNIQSQDPKCDVDIIPNKGKCIKGLKYAMSNSFGFGGNNTSLLFGKVQA